MAYKDFKSMFDNTFVVYNAPKIKEKPKLNIPEFRKWSYYENLIPLIPKKEELETFKPEEPKKEPELKKTELLIEEKIEIPTYNYSSYNTDLDKTSKKNLNAKIAFNHLVRKGLSKAAAAGIVGNLYHENLGNPSLTVNDSRGTKAFGIASFNSSGDLPNFLKWAISNNLDKNKIETLLDYLADYVLSGKNKNLTEVLLNPNTTPELASYAFGRYYEVFAGRNGTGKGYLDPYDDEHVRRRETASAIFNKYNI